jgi:hypothetical protein
VTSARLPIIGLLVILGISGSTSLWLRARSSAGIDFYQMWVGARVAGDVTDFYGPATGGRVGAEYVQRAMTEERSARRVAVARHRQQLEWVSTPLLFTLYAPFRGTYERDLLLFQVLELMALMAAVGLLAWTFGYGVPAALALFAVLVNAFEPLVSDFRVGNVNVLILLLVAVGIALTARRNLMAAGAVFAMAALAKPYVVFLFVLTYAFWMVQRRWRDLASHAAGAAIAGVAALTVSSLYFRSPTIWMEWLRALRDMPQSMVPLEVGNFALAGVTQGLFGINVSALVLVVAAGAAVVVTYKAAPAPQHADQLAIGLGCVMALLGSPLMWIHYLVLTIPLLAYLLRPTGNAPRRQVAAAVALAILAIEPWARFVPATIQVAALVNVGLVVAVIASLFDLRTRGATAAPRGSRQVTPPPTGAYNRDTEGTEEDGESQERSF